MKFYAICIDAFPEVIEMVSLLNANNFSRHHHICCSGFTCATMSSMISGKLGSEMVSGGIGYNTMYEKRFHNWRNNNNNNNNNECIKNTCIMDRILDHKINNIENQDINPYCVYIHNNTSWMNSVIMGKPISDDDMNKHYRDHIFTNENIELNDNFIKTQINNRNLFYTSTNPNKTFNNFVDWNNQTLKKQYYDNEEQYIKSLQLDIFSGIVWIDHCHWHEYAYYQNGQNPYYIDGILQKITRDDAIKCTVDWLKLWNFEEEDAFFYIYADHSHRVKPYLDPPSYMTWCYTKNNIKFKPFDYSGNKHPIITSSDFYHTVEHLFDLNLDLDLDLKILILPDNNKSKYSRTPLDNFDLDRIYGCEDGRASATIKTSASCFLRGSLFYTNDSDNDFDKNNINNINKIINNSETKWISVAKIIKSGLCDDGIYITITKLNFKHTFTSFIFLTENRTEDQIIDNILNIKYDKHFSIHCKDSLSDMKAVTDKFFDIKKDDTKLLELIMKLYGSISI